MDLLQRFAHGEIDAFAYPDSIQGLRGKRMDFKPHIRSSLRTLFWCFASFLET